MGEVCQKLVKVGQCCPKLEQARPKLPDLGRQIRPVFTQNWLKCRQSLVELGPNSGATVRHLFRNCSATFAHLRRSLGSPGVAFGSARRRTVPQLSVDARRDCVAFIHITRVTKSVSMQSHLSRSCATSIHDFYVRRRSGLSLKRLAPAASPQTPRPTTQSQTARIEDLAMGTIATI